MKDYVIINVASPQRILSWTERSLPNGELVGMLTNSVYIKALAELKIFIKFFVFRKIFYIFVLLQYQ